LAHTKDLMSNMSLTDKNGNALTVQYGEDGQISNYNEILESLKEKYNADVETYNKKDYENQNTEAGKTLKSNIEQEKKTYELL
jgi:hypothetical protein